MHFRVALFSKIDFDRFFKEDFLVQSEQFLVHFCLKSFFSKSNKEYNDDITSAKEIVPHQTKTILTLACSEKRIFSFRAWVNAPFLYSLKGGSAQKVSKLRLCISRVQKRREEIDFSCSESREGNLEHWNSYDQKEFWNLERTEIFLPTTISIKNSRFFSSSERRIIRCSIDKKGAC